MRKINLVQIVILLLIGLLFFVVFLPVWSALSISFMGDKASLSPANTLWPSPWSVEAYQVIFSKNVLARSLVNTLYISTLGPIFHMFVVSLAAYALLKEDLPWKKGIQIFFLITMMVPGEVIMIPRFILFKNLNMINNLNSLVIISLASGFSILLMKTFFSTIPFELSEAARIEGAGEFRIFTTLYIPIALPGFMIVLLFEIVNKWNDFNNPLILITKQEMFVLQQTIKGIVLPLGSGQADMVLTYPNIQMAVVVLGLLPIAILYIAFQRHFISGINIGAIKG